MGRLLHRATTPRPLRAQRPGLPARAVGASSLLLHRHCEADGEQPGWRRVADQLRAQLESEKQLRCSVISFPEYGSEPNPETGRKDLHRAMDKRDRGTNSNRSPSLSRWSS